MMSIRKGGKGRVRPALQAVRPSLSSYVAEVKRLPAVDAWTKECLDFDNFEAIGVLGLDIPFTVAAVEQAYQTKDSPLSSDPKAASRVQDAFPRPHRLADLSAAAGLDHLKEPEGRST